MTEVLNGLALCAGAGGLELGISVALGMSYRGVCYVERDCFAASILMARMEESTMDQAPIWDDIKSFDGMPWRGIVDIVSAGFPCQPWSAAGKRRGTADDRWIWPDVARIIRDVEPGLVYLENVPTLLRGGIEHVLRDLARLGFDAGWGCMEAAAVGAPHKRRRLFILAYAKSRGKIRLEGRNGPTWARFDRGSVKVADADRREFGTEYEPVSGSSGSALATPNKLALADSVGERLEEPRRTGSYGDSEYPALVGSRHDVADADSDGRSWERSINELPLAREIACRNDTNGRDGARCDVADAQSRGLGELRQSSGGAGLLECGVEDVADADACGRSDDERVDAERESHPIRIFPPGPNDSDGWRDVLEESPSIEPALCRDAHGLAYRLDRLRVLGNGVVPLAAGYAFRSLAARLAT